MWVRAIVLVLTLAACTSGSTGPSTTTEVTLASTTNATTTTTAEATTVTGPTATTAPLLPAGALTVEAFPVPAGSRPHDVAPAIDGGVWYTAQGSGELGWLDPVTGETRHTDLGAGSRPHGVIVDADGVPWITDSGLNAIVSVDPATLDVSVYALPAEHPNVNLNTATFDNDGILWFTGQDGVYGQFDPASGSMEVFTAPGGSGPYGITTTPEGSIYYASLAGSHIGAIDANGGASVVEPPAADQGARRVWSDSSGAVWVSEWNTGNLSRYQPASGTWDTWPLPGDNPAAYAVFVDDADIVWVSDFGSNSMVRFEPESESFIVLPLPHSPGDVRQILGRFGEVWGAESAADHLVVVRTR